MQVNTMGEMALWTVLGTIGYLWYFVFSGAIFLFTSNIPMTPKRKAQTIRELKLSSFSIFGLVATAMVWFRYIEHLSPWYNYYATHEFGIKDVFTNFIAHLRLRHLVLLDASYVL